MLDKITPLPWYEIGGHVRSAALEKGNYICCVEGRTDFEILANAKLISAAPDLLVALEIAVDQLRHHDIDESMAGEFEILTDAVDKAKGLKPDPRGYD